MPGLALRPALWRTYLSALRRFRSEGDGILPRSFERTASGWTPTEPCPLGTAEVLRCACLLRSRGIDPHFDVDDLLTRLVRQVRTSDYQALALAVSAATAARSPYAFELCRLLEQRLDQSAPGSMGLGWALSAISHVAGLTTTGALSRLAADLHRRLVANQDARSGLFFASARRHGIWRRRRRDTTLSAQTFPIIALTTFALTFDRPEGLAPAVRCADRLVALQGEQGQWWWRYETRGGTVVDRYPVYSVNQDAAMPEALGRLQRALGDRRYDAVIERGLEWQAGRNEVGHSLVDPSAATVARSVTATAAGFEVSWELYAYQPARCLQALLSDPDWAIEAAS